jgi:hypothetical protein
MSTASKMARSGIVFLAILLGGRGACLAGVQDASAASAVASASVDDTNPYAVISKRNVFGLNPPPPPPEPEKPPPAVLPEVYLTGFMRKGDQWKVLLAAKVENPDPHGQPVAYYLTLAEGDKKTVGSGAKQAVVELVKAYAEQEKIDIINAGTPMTLSVKENGIESRAPRPETPPPGTMTAAMRRARRMAARPAWQNDTPEAGTTVAEAGKSVVDGSPAVGIPPSVVTQHPVGAPLIQGGASSKAIIAGGAAGAPQ